MARFASKFGVIKYIPSSIKQEVINVGIIIHSPKESKVAFKFLDYDTRIKNFVTEIQYAEYRAFRKLIGKHLKSLNTKPYDSLINVPLSDENYLEKLQSSVKPPFIIAKPEYIFTDNIMDQIEGLYDNMIITPDEIRTKQKPLIKQVEERLISEGIDRFIERDIQVKNLPFTLNIDFGYRIDGVIDLIQPLSIQESPRENYKEGVFWKDAIEKLHNDKELNSGYFIAIIKPTKNAEKVGFSELIKQFDSIEKASVVNYGTREFDRLIYTLKNHGKLERAL
ncbi:DUF3037 domain-containing protein [Paenibacillus sp. Cedars]|uniref:DUF3037 domain-containing protein n=1 Tax=Paenibacillus sp. Cedars TaxID=1980674 RepID=UPI0011634248|nr:DUF3037 domain-containing protein [Paenibacillus sp. Cedars]AWP30392.1 hypothetical protein B9D94_28985 [Paenibacillus sp. Cedars]